MSPEVPQPAEGALAQENCRGERAAGVSRRRAVVDVTDDSLLVHHERHSLGHTKDAQHPIKLGDRFRCVAQQRERHAQLARKSGVRLGFIDAESENLRLSVLKLGETSLVRLEFVGSGGRVGEDEKCKDNVLAAAKIAQLDSLARVAGELEIGRCITYSRLGH